MRCSPLPADLLANDSDADGDALAIVEVKAATGGTAQLLGDGNVLFEPALNFNGLAGFDYVISDGAGGLAGAAVTIDIAAVNDAPVAFADEAATSEDTAVTILAADLLANDGDVEGDPLALQSVGGALNGSASLTAEGDVLFTPDPDFNGIAGFEYTLTDGQGGTASALVTVTVTPANNAPAPSDDLASTTEDTAVVILTADLLSNDRDIDGDPVTLQGVSNGTGGTAVLTAEGDVLFTPNADFTGLAGFSYTVTDPSAAVGEAQVIVEVTPVNDAPVPVDDQVSTAEDTAVTIAAADLLANDRDVDGDPLTLQSVSNGVGGAAVLTLEGDVLFTPDANFNGTATFSYTVADQPSGATGAAQVLVDVTPVNDPPLAAPDAVTAEFNTERIIDDVYTGYGF